MQLKGILFDYDGTLVDSEGIHLDIWNQVLQPYGVRVSVEEYRNVHVGKPTPRNAEDLVRLHELKVSPERLVEKKQAAYRDWLKTSQPPLMPYVRETVAWFREQGMKLAVVTGSARAGVLSNLQHNGLIEAMDALVTRDDVEHSKPHPESYLRGLRALELPAAACVAFEDTENGVRSAHAAGLVCYAVTHELSRDHDFSLAARVFGDLDEAGRWIASAHR